MIHSTILLVEDNRDDELLTLSALLDASIKNHVDIVRDGAEALDYLFKRGTYVKAQTPQLILLDLKLPKVSGLEVLKEIRNFPGTHDIPVVIFTSSKEERDVIDGYRLGANSYIQKPIDFVEFDAAVKRLGMYWLVLNQFPPTEH